MLSSNPETISEIRAYFQGVRWAKPDPDELIEITRRFFQDHGLDFDNLQQVDHFLLSILEPQWKDCGLREQTLTAQIREEYRKAGATEPQLNWGKIENIPLSRKSERRVHQLREELDALRTSALPIMGMAAALNETKARLTHHQMKKSASIGSLPHDA